MADFNSLVNDVYAITNRSDLVAETQLAVRSATLQLHRSDFYYKDIKEVALQFDVSDYLQAIDYRSLFPNYRALKYLRKYDPTASAQPEKGVGAFFKVKTPAEILDSYGASLSDICYVAGALIQVKSSTLIQYALIGVYENPVVATPETFKSWIADEAPYAIIYTAAAKVYGNVLGNKAKKDSCNEDAMKEFLEVKNANIIAEGY